MPSARDHDWTHVHVIGDKGEAALYLPFARKLLGFVKEQAAYNALGTYRAVRTMTDGAVISAEIHGSIPRITIKPPRRATPRPVKVEGDIVVWARDASHPNGIDPTYPQQVLRFRDGLVTTLFKERDIPLYDVFQGSKGVYESDNAGRPLFPDGIRYAGNVDWIGQHGERVSWYGPSTRYWLDPFVQPSAQYGRYVFMLGRRLLDVDAYFADDTDNAFLPHRYVLGAALHEGALYVVLADLPDGFTTTGTIPAYTLHADQPFPIGDVPTMLCRFGIHAIPPEQGAGFEVTAKSLQVIDTQDVAGGCAPWFFNESATHAVSCTLPTNIVIRANMDGTVVASPSTNSSVARWTDGAFSQSVVSATHGGEPAPMAIDWDGDQEVVASVVRKPCGDLDNGFEVAIGRTRFPLREINLTGPAADPAQIQDGIIRKIIFADARFDLAVLMTYRAETDFSSDYYEVEQTIEAYRAGKRIAAIDIPDGLGSGLEMSLLHYYTEFHDAGRDDPVSPQFPLYALFAGEYAPFTTGFDFQGGHAYYAYFPAEADDVFGVVQNAGSSPEPATKLDAIYTDAGYGTLQPDTLGHPHTVGCATVDDVTAFSGYGGNPATKPHTFFCADGERTYSLPDLTGITPSQASFHPVWALGNILKEPA